MDYSRPDQPISPERDSSERIFPGIERLLSSLDFNTVHLQALAKQIVGETPLEKPSNVSDPAGIGVYSAEHDQVAIFERTLAEKYGSDFDAVGWHGRSSQQRILWQEREFINAIQRPLVVRAILDRRRNYQEVDNGAGNTVSSMFLGGLVVNQPSYLLTASPNWRVKPEIQGVSWNKLDDMTVSGALQQVTATVDSSFLQMALLGLRTVGQVMAEMTVSPNVRAESAQLSRSIDKASTRAMINGIMSLLDLSRATVIVRGEAGESTDIERMNGQCLEVMSEYENLLGAHSGRHDLVLSYGLVSHALDAKHLAAVMIYGLKLGRTKYRLVKDDRAINSVKRLLEGAATGAIGSQASALMRARLRQIIRLITDSRKELDLTETQLGDTFCN